MHVEPVLAAGRPPNDTVALPLVTMPRCVAGAMYGSLGWRPTCGGVLTPLDPVTAAGCPPMSTVDESPCVSGDEWGSGGDGCGAPLAGFGI